jgi:hypothetical protein
MNKGKYTYDYIKKASKVIVRLSTDKDVDEDTFDSAIVMIAQLKSEGFNSHTIFIQQAVVSDLLGC